MSLVKNINRRKKLGISRSKKDSTVSPKAYKAMKNNWKDKKKAQVAKKKFDLNKVEHETRSKYKKTSQDTRRPKLSSMNKSKKRNFKKYARQGR